MPAARPGLYAWRKRTARALDESVGYVLPRAALGRLASRMPATLHDLRAALGRRAAGFWGQAAWLCPAASICHRMRVYAGVGLTRRIWRCTDRLHWQAKQERPFV